MAERCPMLIPKLTGRARSAQNAVRHGLNRVSSRHPEYRDDIYFIARMMCGGDSSPELFDTAVRVAECDVLIREIRSYRNRLLSRLMDPFSFPLTQARMERRLRLESHEDSLTAGKELLAAVPEKNASPEKRVQFNELVTEYFAVGPDRGPEAALLAALPDLVRVSEYERRAWSRRRRSFLQYMALKSGYRAPTLMDRSKIMKRSTMGSLKP